LEESISLLPQLSTALQFASRRGGIPGSSVRLPAPYLSRAWFRQLKPRREHRTFGGLPTVPQTAGIGPQRLSFCIERVRSLISLRLAAAVVCIGVLASDCSSINHRTATPARTTKSPSPTAPPRSPATTTTTAPTTVVDYVAPVSADDELLPSLTVSETLHGTCEPGSDSVSNAPVYRCFVNSGIYDPCWAVAGSQTPTASVVCWHPWSTTVIEIETPGLSTSPYEATNLDYPWGVQLTSGQQCIAMQGAHSEADGQVVNYGCGTTTGGLQLLGTPDRSAALWTFEAASDNGAGEYAAPEKVSVGIAFFARP